MSEQSGNPGEFRCRVCGWSGVMAGRQRCKACDRARARRWRASNADRAKAKDAAWHAANRAEVLARVAALKEARLAWMRSGNVVRGELAALARGSDCRCTYCGDKVRVRTSPHDPIGFDHVVPRCAGGEHTVSNMVVCCRQCNLEKGVRVYAHGIPRTAKELSHD